jgi:hypothetical protein
MVIIAIRTGVYILISLVEMKTMRGNLIKKPRLTFRIWFIR